MPRGRHHKKPAKKGFRGFSLLLISMTAALILGFFLSPLVIRWIDKDFSSPVLSDVSQTLQTAKNYFQRYFSFLTEFASAKSSDHRQTEQKPANQANPAAKTESQAAKPEQQQPGVQNPAASYLLQFAAYEVQSIRVATIASEERAKAERAALAEKGFSAGIVASGEYVAVQVGAFLSEAEAEPYLLQLKAEGYNDAYLTPWQIKSVGVKRNFAEQKQDAIGNAVQEFDAILAAGLSAEPAAQPEVIRQRAEALQTMPVQFSRPEQQTFWQQSLQVLLTYLQDNGTNQSNQRLQLIEAVLTLRSWCTS
ncbi:MAG: SPOR domain-containing protein [Negativicutes bacterium]|nr:SPOR domain-containing protein [Negativicutes bacterium]